MKKLVVTLLFATIAGALTFGAAATLNVNAQNLGSGGATVESCQKDIAVGFAQVEGEPQHIAGITLTEVSAVCAGQTISYIVSDQGSKAVATGSGVLSANPTQTFGFRNAAGEAFDVPAASIGEVGVTIAGTPAAEPAPPVQP